MSTSIIQSNVLDQVGDVPHSYVHHDRQVEPRQPLIAGRSIFKWYNVFSVADPIPDGLEDFSRNAARELVESGVVNPEYGMGVAVLHHSTANDFLMLGGWRGHQEYWHSVFARAANTDEPWVPLETGAFAPIICVWEMAPIWHERNAWVTHLNSDRAVEDHLAWLDGTLAAEM